MQIFIHKNGQQLGPFNESVVKQKLQNRDLLPTDLAILQGEQSWQKLGEMFPQTSPTPSLPVANEFSTPNNQAPSAVSGGGKSKGLIFGLLGCGGLLIFGVIGVAVAIFLGSPKSGTDTASNSSPAKKTDAKITKPTALKQAKILNEKADELMAFAPRKNLQTNPMIKGKLAIVKKDKDDVKADIVGFDYQDNFFDAEISDLSLSQNRFATSIEEIGTLIQLSCQKGGALGTYSGGAVAYANTCKITVIDYKTPAIIDEKTYTNNTPPLEIESRSSNREFVLLKPAEINEYLIDLPVEKLAEPLIELPFENNDQRYGDYMGLMNLAPELFRTVTTENLTGAPSIRGKIAYIEKDAGRQIKLMGFDVYGKEYSKYDHESIGVGLERLATSIDDVETVIRVDCRPGAKLGNIGRIAVYSNRCEVAIVDYKTLQTIAKKIFENKEMAKDVNKKIYHSRYIVLKPDTEINDFLKSLPKN
jgi:hypothetical protein